MYEIFNKKGGLFMNNDMLGKSKKVTLQMEGVSEIDVDEEIEKMEEDNFGIYKTQRESELLRELENKEKLIKILKDMGYMEKVCIGIADCLVSGDYEKIYILLGVQKQKDNF